AGSAPMSAPDRIHSTRLSGDPGVPSKPPTSHSRMAASARRRVHPALIQFAATIAKTSTTTRVSIVMTGPTADARTGTKVPAPAYDGHTGPVDPTNALSARAAAARAPSARPIVITVCDSRRPVAADHTGAAPAMSARPAANSVSPTVLVPRRTAS